MKRLIGAALLLTLVSCGEQSKSKSNKGPSGNSTTTQDINTQTNFTNPNPYRCLLDIDLIEIKALETTKLEEKNKKKKKKKANVTADQEKVFNLVLPDEITNTVIAELKANFALDGDIDPARFWNIIDEDTASALNQILVSKFMNDNETEFDLKRKYLAYAFTYFFEKQDISKGYSVTNVNSDSESTFTIAFSNKVKQKFNMPVCDTYDIQEIEVPTELIIPSDIKTKITCTAKPLFSKRRTIHLEALNDTEMSIILEKGDETRTYEVSTKKADVESKNKKYDTVVYNTLSFEEKITLKIWKDKKESKYLDNTTKKITITVKDTDTDNEFSYTNLKCKTVKPLIRY